MPVLAEHESLSHKSKNPGSEWTLAVASRATHRNICALQEVTLKVFQLPKMKHYLGLSANLIHHSPWQEMGELIFPPSILEGPGVGEQAAAAASPGPTGGDGQKKGSGKCTPRPRSISPSFFLSNLPIRPVTKHRQKVSLANTWESLANDKRR